VWRETPVHHIDRNYSASSHRRRRRRQTHIIPAVMSSLYIYSGPCMRCCDMHACGLNPHASSTLKKKNPHYYTNSCIVHTTRAPCRYVYIKSTDYLGRLTFSIQEFVANIFFAFVQISCNASCTIWLKKLTNNHQSVMLVQISTVKK
jgi:hypothetical protein